MKSFEDIILENAAVNEVRPPGDAAPRLKKMTGIKAVVFDVYGTLFSSSAGDISLVKQGNMENLMRQALESCGIRIMAADTYQISGMFQNMIQSHQEKQREKGVEYPEVDIRKVWQELLGELHKTKVISYQSFPNIERMAIRYESLVNPVQRMPGLEDCIRSISRSSRVMSIISNAQFYTPSLFPAFLGRTLDELGFCEECSIWSYRLLEAKPSQRLYREAAERLYRHHGISREQVLFAGNDIKNDIWPAQESGFKTALFAGDSLSLRRRADDDACRHVVADIEITGLHQILECLD